MLKTLLPIILIRSSSCATYRTNSDISFDSIDIKPYTGKVKLSLEPILNRKLTSLGTVIGEVKKRNILTKDPTKEQANYVLLLEAEKLGADAVMDVKYDSGTGLTTWGYIEATGTAIKFDEPQTKNPP